jgi:hypothetical protein
MASNPASPHQSMVNLYSTLMQEAKFRVLAISSRMKMLQHSDPPPEAFIEAEFCFLQIRLICETVALASIVAHSPLGLRKDLLKSWHAEKSFAMLRDINPHCFPIPIEVDESVRPNKINKAKGEFLKVGDLQDIYNKCGDFLHRGSAKQMLAGKREIDIGKIRSWTNAFVQLLSTHMIAIAGLDALYLVNFGEAGDRVQVFLAKSAESPSQI